jgi:hypothetical protein
MGKRRRAVKGRRKACIANETPGTMMGKNAGQPVEG